MKKTKPVQTVKEKIYDDISFVGSVVVLFLIINEIAGMAK